MESMARARRSFTKEYKVEVMKLIRTSGKSVGAVSRELGLTETSVRAWVKRAEIDERKDPQGPLTSEERAENTRLRRELKTVTMERDFLRNILARLGESPGRRETPSAMIPQPERCGRQLIGDVGARHETWSGGSCGLEIGDAIGDPV